MNEVRRDLNLRETERGKERGRTRKIERTRKGKKKEWVREERGGGRRGSIPGL